MSEQQPWEQLPGESALWFGRFERYRLMWPHSVVEVYRDEWRAEHRKARVEKGGKEGVDSTLEAETPKEAPNKWYETARQFHWESRAAAWNASQMAVIEQRIATERAQMVLLPYVQQHQRVAALSDQAEQLIAMAQDPDKVWVPDVKAIGNGPNAERVDLVQFNGALFHEIRATLDDIAAEMGERVKKKEIAYRELPPDRYEGIDEGDEGSEE